MDNSGDVITAAKGITNATMVFTITVVTMLSKVAVVTM
jgi:hypothetical protein